MSRMCKGMIIGFSCLVFVMFLAWSASDPGKSSNKVVLMPIEEEPNVVVITTNKKDDDIINPQVAYRQTVNRYQQGVQLQQGGVQLQRGGVQLQRGGVQIQRGGVQLQRGGVQPQQGVQLQPDVQLQQDGLQLQQDVRPETFFSALNLTFADIKLLENNSIPTEIFIAACTEMGPFLSKLGSGISVIRKEVESNLQDINRMYIQDKDSYHTLQAMVLSEIDSGVVMKHHTCSRSLRWIRRMFEFISIFLEKLASGEKDLTKAARVAYDTTISMHHNYFIRKAITTGLHLLPRYNTFLISMSVNQADAKKTTFEQQFNEDVLHYISTLKPICNNIQQFYTDHNLEN